tara:strand:+ start:256 stop:390 length:135 start_codon:yes stop_codon:yes gene_type:complete
MRGESPSPIFVQAIVTMPYLARGKLRLFEKFMSEGGEKKFDVKK